MKRMMVGVLVLPLVSALGLLLSGCTDENDSVAGGPLQKGAAGSAASNPKIKAIMTTVGKGPQSIQENLKAALKEASPAWDFIQPKAKEYAQLTAEMGGYDPPRGDKSSWTKLAQAFADSASELDKAAGAKDKEKTLASLDSLGNSCQGCHRQHRMMRGPGGGGPPGFGPPGGGRPGFGPPGGGPPGVPGGPGGPPPGAGPGGPPSR